MCTINQVTAKMATVGCTMLMVMVLMTISVVRCVAPVVIMKIVLH